MGQFAQVPADTFQTLQIDAGIVAGGFVPATGVVSDLLGATTGGLTFNSNPTYEDFGSDVDNVPDNTWQLKRVTGYDPALSGTFVTMSGDLAKQLSGAGALASGKVTPSHVLAAADFDDIWFIGDYSDKNSGAANAGYVAIHIMKGLNTSGFQLKTAKKGKGNFAFEFHGHYDLTDPDTVPFEIYVKAGTAA